MVSPSLTQKTWDVVSTLDIQYMLMLTSQRIPFLVAFLVIICACQRLPRLIVPKEHCLIAVAFIHE